MAQISAEARIKELGLELPPIRPAGGIYKPCLIDGRHLYVSGHGPYKSDGTSITGKVGKDITLDDGKAAAKQVGLAILATIKNSLGSLDKIRRVIKILGMVNCEADFEKQPYVINGCSELFAQIWGDENGIGVRSAVGMGSLPGNIAVEIEVLFELQP